MSANQNARPEAAGANTEGRTPPSKPDAGVHAADAEQVRRDVFREAVERALARQDRAAARGRRGQVNCAEILTTSELKFLLRQDA